MPPPQENPLPPEVVKMGRPLQIHAGLASMTGLALLVMGVLFLLGAGLMVYIYLKVPFKKGDPTAPETMIYLAVGVGTLGLLACLGAWWRGGLIGEPEEAYLIYPEAMVWLRGNSFDLVRWEDITTLVSPKHWGDYHVTTRDRRTLPIKHAVKNYGTLIGTVFTQAARVILAPLRSALEAGETVCVGPFELNRVRIGYKGKNLAWENVAVLRIEIGRLGRRLRIRASGSLLPFCYCDLNSFPNGVLFPGAFNHRGAVAAAKGTILLDEVMGAAKSSRWTRLHDECGIQAGRGRWCCRRRFVALRYPDAGAEQDRRLAVVLLVERGPRAHQRGPWYGGMSF
jgi:hypothetical protein